jgi:predicted RNA-binding Zn-ribbon protein involved in translation (DUF1610 family)
MSETNVTSILAISVQEDLGLQFMQDVCGDQQHEAVVHHTPVHIDVLAGDPRLNVEWDDTIKKAQALVLLTRFLDIITLDKLRAIYRRIPGESEAPIMVLSVREKDEADFKMSCPVCGQKLWVRDSDAGKRGRCPNCKKAFTLPEQIGHLRAQLALPDSVDVLRSVQGDKKSAETVITKLLEKTNGGIIEPSMRLDENVLKQSTIRVQINPDDM